VIFGIERARLALKDCRLIFSKPLPPCKLSFKPLREQQIAALKAEPTYPA